MPDRTNSDAPAEGRLARLAAMIAAYVRMPLAEKLLLPLAWLLLGLSSIAAAFLPFRSIAPVLGGKVSPNFLPLPIDSARLIRAQRIRNAVNRSARLMPLRSDCLPQALAASMLCRLLAMPSSAHIGVKQDAADGGMAAHAWVHVGDFWVSGGQSIPEYAPIACFARPWR